MVGIIARNTLLQIYQSFVFPYYMYDGIAAWGQAAQSDLRKILVLQKRALHIIFFCNTRTHAIPLFVSSNIPPTDMLYFETVFTLMHDISNNSVPKNIQKLLVTHLAFANIIHVHQLWATIMLTNCELA